MIHVIQNDPEVPAGIIGAELRRQGAPWQAVKVFLGEPLPEPRDSSGVIVLGGAMGANDDRLYPFLTKEKEFIRTTAAAGTPYLGICLGGQLLAAALGARVASDRWAEIGTSTVALTAAGKADPLLRGVPGEFPVFQWHHDSFDLPPSAVLLASSPVCPHQAFRAGERAWGLQFHPEVDEAIIGVWCGREDAASAARAGTIEAAWRAAESGFREIAQRLVANFLALGGNGGRP